MLAAAPTAAGHTEIDRRFFDAFQFQTPIQIPLGSRVQGRGLGIGLVEQTFHRAFRRTIADHDEIPRLHEPHRAGMMRRREQSHQHVVRNRVRKKISAHVTALEDRPVDGLPIRARKSPADSPHKPLPSSRRPHPGIGVGPHSPRPTFPKHTGHRQSRYLDEIQSICGSVMPAFPHQQPYWPHSNISRHSSQVF